jgi:endoglucanase
MRSCVHILRSLQFASFGAIGLGFLACELESSQPLTNSEELPSGSGGMPTGTGGAGATLHSLVEDVEDGDTSILKTDDRSGSWYSYSETGSVTLDPSAEGHASHAMGVAFAAVDAGWSGFGFNFKGESGKEPYDASPYTGISFWVRSDVAVTMNFAVADVVTDPDGDVCTECHDHWQVSIDIGTEWKQVTLHWSDLARGAWGIPESDALVLTQLFGLAWNVEAPGNVTVFVDDLLLLADGVTSGNVTTTFEPPPSMGGAPGDAPGGLAWVDGGPPTGPSPVETHGQLHVAAGRLRNEAEEPAVLRGQALAWDNWWPQYHNADVVSWLREDWCVDIVRPAMGIEPTGAYLENPEASIARMRAVVEAAIESGVYVIIDWHAHDLHQDEAIAFFSEMAQSYGDQPNVMYEIFNEPETEETWPDVKAYAEAVIPAIRQFDPDNVVIVGTPEWDQRIDLAANDPITTDPNILYAVHFYAGTHGSALRTRVSDALAAGLPVYISESGGSEADGLGANNYEEWGAWQDFLDDNQIGWINWAIADKDAETVSMLRPGASATGGWTEADLTGTGVHVRSLLRSYNCP